MQESKSDILTSNVVKSCFSILKQEKSLIIFPILSGVFVTIASLILYWFATIYFVDGQVTFSLNSLKNFIDFISSDYEQFGIPFLLIYLFITYTIVVFFETALAISVYKVVNGQNPTVAGSLGKVIVNIFKVIAWAFISALVGTLFKVLERKSRGIGSKIFVGIAEIGWALLTYFVVPILAIEKLGILETIKKSGSTLKETWGENIVAQVKLLFFFIPYTFLVAIAFIAAFNVDSTFWFTLLFAAGAVGFFAIVIISSTIHSILRTVLFIYASTGQVAGGFMKESLQNAFKPKQAKTS